MAWLLSLPIWVLFWSIFLHKKSAIRISTKYYVIISSLALIFVMGLRNRYTGTMDTYQYTLVFEGAQKYTDLLKYLESVDVLEGSLIFSEAGFFVYTWTAAQILPSPQWFLLFTSVIIVSMTAKFIYENSEDPTISWITFICLGSFTFVMNGMRQALAMSICLLSYRYVKEKKPIRFLLTVLLAVLFHKSAIIFAIVYLLRNLKLNLKSFALLSVGFVGFIAMANRLAVLYDSMTGEDYSEVGSFESGGIINVLIYLIAIVGMLIVYRRIKTSDDFLPLALVIVGFSLYISRFITAQIYERVSYYFAYFLMLAFPTIFKDLKSETRTLMRMAFMFAAIVLFAYRISKGAFADFRLIF